MEAPLRSLCWETGLSHTRTGMASVNKHTSDGEGVCLQPIRVCLSAPSSFKALSRKGILSKKEGHVRRLKDTLTFTWAHNKLSTQILNILQGLLLYYVAFYNIKTLISNFSVL